MTHWPEELHIRSRGRSRHTVPTAHGGLERGGSLDREGDRSSDARIDGREVRLRTERGGDRPQPGPRGFEARSGPLHAAVGKAEPGIPSGAVQVVAEGRPIDERARSLPGGLEGPGVQRSERTGAPVPVRGAPSGESLPAFDGGGQDDQGHGRKIVARLQILGADLQAVGSRPDKEPWRIAPVRQEHDRGRVEHSEAADDRPRIGRPTEGVDVGRVPAQLETGAVRGAHEPEPAQEHLPFVQGVVGQSTGDARREASGWGGDLGMGPVGRPDCAVAADTSQRILAEAPRRGPRQDLAEQKRESHRSAVAPDRVLLFDAGDRGRSHRVADRVG